MNTDYLNLASSAKTSEDLLMIYNAIRSKGKTKVQLEFNQSNAELLNDSLFQ